MKYSADDVLDAAIVVVAEHGAAVSTATIAKSIGVSNGTLFNYFPTKQALLDAMYLAIKRQLGAAIGSIDPALPLRDQARQIWQHWIDWATANPSAWRVGHLLHAAELASDDAVAEAMTALDEPMMVLARIEEAGRLANLPVAYVGALIQAQLDVAIELRLDEPGVAAAFDVMWNGITATTSDPSTTTTATTATTTATTTADRGATR